MATKSASALAQGRSRSNTLSALEKVIDSHVAGNEKISIASIAGAAGVTPASSIIPIQLWRKGSAR